jgi:hypothetical protein
MRRSTRICSWIAPAQTTTGLRPSKHLSIHCWSAVRTRDQSAAIAERRPITCATLGERKLGAIEGGIDGEGDRYPYAVTTTIASTMAPNTAVRIRDGKWGFVAAYGFVLGVVAAVARHVIGVRSGWARPGANR